MPWVPIHESGLSYSFHAVSEADNLPTLVDSTVLYLRGEEDYQSESDWYLVFDPPIAGPIRVTAETYIAGTDRQGSMYTPGHLAVFNDDYFEESYVYNEAAPYPSDNYPDDDGVTAWEPNPTELWLPVPIAVLYYGATSTTSDFVRDDREYAFLIEVWQDAPPPSGGECFWTDLLGVAEDCGGSTKGQQVDAIISSWYGEFSEYSSWMWRAGVLYEPPDPPGETTYHWMPALPPGTTIWHVRNTAVGGAQIIDHSSFYIDFEQGRIGTDEIVASPVTNDWGGSGPYGASGLFIDLDGVDLSQLYPLLPPEYQYADAEYYAWLPARRGSAIWRTSVNVQLGGYGAGEWQLFAYADPSSSNAPLVNGVTPAPTSIVATTPTPSGPAGGGVMYISPPGYEESAYLNNVVLALNYYPQGLSHINIKGWLAPEIGVALPGVIDAYIDDLEYFEGEDVAIGEFLFPPAGTGVAFPDVRLPVTWNMDWEAWGLGAEWGDAQNTAISLPSGPGVYIGTLRRANGTAICKVAYMLGQGGDPGA